MPGRKSICQASAEFDLLLDPTSGSVGNTGLVTVAVVPDPRHAIPLHGTFFGFPSDHLGMEVQVSVMSGTPNVIWAAPQPGDSLTFWPISVIDVERDVERGSRRAAFPRLRL